MFRVTEYAKAEAQFISTTLDELSRSRGGIVGLIGREPAQHIGATQVDLEDGSVVEFEGTEIAASMSVPWEAISTGDVVPLLATLDKAADQHHEQLSEFIFRNLDQLTAATGNQVSAAGKSHFQYMYEMYDTIELTFDDEGKISSGFTMVASEETAERMAKGEAEMTTAERQQLDELIDRKRKEYFARRRRRKLS